MKTTALDKIIRLAGKGIVLLLPFFFLPFSTNFAGFNKVSLIVFLALVLLLLFAVRIFTTKKFPKFFTGRKLDYLVLIYLGSQVLFTLFSSNPMISIFGEYGQWYPSLIVSTALVIFYFVFSAIFVKKDLKSIYILLSVGLFVASLGSVVAHFAGIKPEYMADTLFGSGSEIAVYGLIGALFSVYFILRDDFSANFRYFQIAAFVVNCVLIYLTGFTAAFVVLIAAVLALYFLSEKQTQKTHMNYFVFFGLISAVLLALTLLPVSGILSRNIIQNPELKFSDAVGLARSAFSRSPLVGNGLATELESFTINRPQSVNNSDYSDNIFLEYFSDTTRILVTTGFFGIVFYLGLLTVGVKFGVVNEDDTNQKEKFWAGVVLALIAITSFVFSGGVLLGFLIFAFLSFVTLRDEEIEERNLTMVPAYVLSILLAIVALGGVYGFGRIYLAEQKYKMALDALKNDDGAATFDYLRDVRNLNPLRSEYRRSLAQIEMAIASLVAEQGTLDEQAQGDIQILIQDAVSNVKANTEQLNRNSTVEWQARGETYLALSRFISGTNELTLDAYNHAAELDPNNAHLRERIGNIYLKLDDRESALKAFDDAIKLKPSLYTARLSRAAILIAQSKNDDAKADLEFILANDNSASTTYESAKTLLDNLPVQ